jgi:hypothetical protein
VLLDCTRTGIVRGKGKRLIAIILLFQFGKIRHTAAHILRNVVGPIQFVLRRRPWHKLHEPLCPFG